MIAGILRAAALPITSLIRSLRVRRIDGLIARSRNEELRVCDEVNLRRDDRQQLIQNERTYRQRLYLLRDEIASGS